MRRSIFDNTMQIRPAAEADAAAWLEMRRDLWPDSDTDHERDVMRYFQGDLREPTEVLVAESVDGRLLGFAELFIRNNVNGCHSGNVAYLEGWYVRADARRQGIGRALVQAAEAWGRQQGCTEFASDVELDNEGSIRAHEALGFEETDRVVCFRKDIG